MSEPGSERPPERLGHAGFSLETDAQLALLRELHGEPYASLTAALRASPRVNPGFGGERFDARGLIHNGYFPSPDAELYGSLILRERPRAIVEIGAGFSTLVARAAIEHGRLDTSLHVIDPEPRAPVADVADTIEQAPVQTSSLRERGVEAGTLLFIDSSHVVEAGGDGPYLYCSLLPSLPAGVLVHVHDVFLPYDYPAVYRRMGYAEQYLLHALLADNRRLRVVLAVYYLCREHPEPMRALLGPEVGTGLFGGASFWVRTVDPLPESSPKRRAP